MVMMAPEINRRSWEGKLGRGVGGVLTRELCQGSGKPLIGGLCHYLANHLMRGGGGGLHLTELVMLAQESVVGEAGKGSWEESRHCPDERALSGFC
jgi:hypothetical protein